MSKWNDYSSHIDPSERESFCGCSVTAGVPLPMDHDDVLLTSRRCDVNYLLMATRTSSRSTLWRTVTQNLRADEPSLGALRRALVAYVLSRVLVLIAGAVSVAAWAVRDRQICRTLTEVGRPDRCVDPRGGARALLDFFAMWDGNWYMHVARSGYPHVISNPATYENSTARAAFFPLYPRIIHYLDVILPGGPVWVAALFNLILGAVVIYLIGRMAKMLFDDKTAEKTMIIVALFPGSFVFGWIYSETTFFMLTALSLIALHKKHWVTAGILASLAGLARPNALALMVACVVASIVAIKRDREWRSLWAPALSPLGYVGFMLFLWHHTGEKLSWFRVQREAWNEGTSFGVTAISRLVSFVTNPFSSPSDLLTAASLVLMGLMLWTAHRHRLPLPMITYSLGILVLMLMPATVTARPRFLFTAFPLLISAGAMLRDDDDTWWPILIVLLSGSLIGVTALYGVFGAIP